MPLSRGQGDRRLTAASYLVLCSLKEHECLQGTNPKRTKNKKSEKKRRKTSNMRNTAKREKQAKKLRNVFFSPHLLFLRQLVNEACAEIRSGAVELATNLLHHTQQVDAPQIKSPRRRVIRRPSHFLYLNILSLEEFVQQLSSVLHWDHSLRDGCEDVWLRIKNIHSLCPFR